MSESEPTFHLAQRAHQLQSALNTDACDKRAYLQRLVFTFKGVTTMMCTTISNRNYYDIRTTLVLAVFCYFVGTGHTMAEDVFHCGMNYSCFTFVSPVDSSSLPRYSISSIDGTQIATDKYFTNPVIYEVSPGVHTIEIKRHPNLRSYSNVAKLIDVVSQKNWGNLSQEEKDELLGRTNESTENIQLSLAAGGQYFIRPATGNEGDSVTWIAQKITNPDVIAQIITGKFGKVTRIDSSISTEQQIICEKQELLALLGYDPGPIDGISGSRTERAILDFMADTNARDASIVTLRDKYKAMQKGLEETTRIGTERPANGEVMIWPDMDIAPLTVTTPKGEKDFYFKLEDLTGHAVIAVYVRAGSSVQVKVPLGYYTLKYATGKKWLSKRCLFGRETGYNKTQESLGFYLSGMNAYGQAVQLIPQSDGNLSTSPVLAKDW